jgi:hypothetical protein
MFRPKNMDENAYMHHGVSAFFATILLDGHLKREKEVQIR